MNFGLKFNQLQKEQFWSISLTFFNFIWTTMHSVKFWTTLRFGGLKNQSD